MKQKRGRDVFQLSAKISLSTNTSASKKRFRRAVLSINEFTGRYFHLYAVESVYNDAAYSEKNGHEDGM